MLQFFDKTSHHYSLCPFGPEQNSKLSCFKMSSFWESKIHKYIEAAWIKVQTIKFHKLLKDYSKSHKF